MNDLQKIKLHLDDLKIFRKINSESIDFLSSIQKLNSIRRINNTAKEGWSDDEIKINALHKFALFFKNGLNNSEYTSTRIASALYLIKNENVDKSLRILMNGLAAKSIEVICRLEKRIENPKIKNIFETTVHRLKKHKILGYDDRKKTDTQKLVDEYQSLKIEWYGRGEDIQFMRAYREMSRAIGDLTHGGLDSELIEKWDRESSEIICDLSEFLQKEFDNFMQFFKKLNDILGFLKNSKELKYQNVDFYSYLLEICENYKDISEMNHKDWCSIKKRLNAILFHRARLI